MGATAHQPGAVSPPRVGRSQQIAEVHIHFSGNFHVGCCLPCVRLKWQSRVCVGRRSGGCCPEALSGGEILTSAGCTLLALLLLTLVTRTRAQQTWSRVDSRAAPLRRGEYSAYCSNVFISVTLVLFVQKVRREKALW